MRPRKTILLVDGKDSRRSERAFILSIRAPFLVFMGSSAANAWRWLSADTPQPDLLLISDTVDGQETVIDIARHRFPEIRVLLLLDRDGRLPQGTIAEAARPWPTGETSQILETCRTMTARKRGPKKPRRPPTLVLTANGSAA